jgi:hypothetical protein
MKAKTYTSTQTHQTDVTTGEGKVIEVRQPNRRDEIKYVKIIYSTALLAKLSTRKEENKKPYISVEWLKEWCEEYRLSTNKGTFIETIQLLKAIE